MGYQKKIFLSKNFPLIITLTFTVIFILFYACEKIEHEKILKITTGEITDTTTTTATVKGVIIDAGEEGINEHGHCWSTSQNPTVSVSTKTELGSNNSAGSFTSKLTDLLPGTTYYVKAYATNSEETVYGDTTIIFSTSDTLPTISTIAVSNITWNSATIGGNATANGGAPITTRGVCWSIFHNPTITDDTTINGSGKGSFSSNLFGLLPGTTYYARAYATNSEGTGYGNEIIINTILYQTGIFEDSRDGKVYKTVKIGDKWWMAENLNYYSPRDSWYYMDDSSAYAEIYGRLYSWEISKNVCPNEWHLPSEIEWKSLETELGMDQTEVDKIGWRGPDPGNQLLTEGKSGFEALTAGYRFYTGNFFYFGSIACFWSSTEANYDFAWCRFLTKGTNEGVNRTYFIKRSGFSVRCIKDEVAKK